MRAPAGGRPQSRIAFFVRPRADRFAYVVSSPNLGLGLGALSVVLVGCGPTLYVGTMIPASTAVHEAEQAGAAETAPYDYWLAQAYLEKAAEEANDGEYQDAIRLAEWARDHAERALLVTHRAIESSAESAADPSGRGEGAARSEAPSTPAPGALPPSSDVLQPVNPSGAARSTTTFRSQPSTTSGASSAVDGSAGSSSSTSRTPRRSGSSQTLQPLGPGSEVP